MNSAFRSLGPALERRLEASPPDFTPAIGVLRARVVRIVAGAVGVAGAFVMFGAATVSLIGAPYAFATHMEGALTWMLLAAIGATFTAVVVARRRFVARWAERLVRPPALTGDPARDLAALEMHEKASPVERVIGRLELASVALPLAAWAMLAPLTIHLVVGLLLWGLAGQTLRFSEYDTWIGLSTMLVGVPHLTLAVCSFFFARKIRRLDVEQVQQLGHVEAVKALGITTLVSLFPGIFLVAIPTILVALTGAIFVPAVFRSMRNRVIEERITLEAMSSERVAA
jgi:hypothetical protein